MDRFAYRHGELYCEDVPLRQIAEAAGTPTYVYSAGTFEDHYRAATKAFAPVNPLICFSIKSCQNIHIMRRLVRMGAGIDVVSGGELYRAIKAGVDPAKIVYAGVGKTDREITEAMDAGIGWFNVESEAELANLCQMAGERRQVVRAALRINPDVDPKTHRHTTTGKRQTKFGVDIERARKVFNEFGRDEWVRLRGIHFHLGSPIPLADPYFEAITKALQLIAELRKDGFAIEVLNLGGGFAASYRADQTPTFPAYAERIMPLLAGQNLSVILEPGRSIAANAGILLTRVVFVKQGGDKRFVIVDAAMTDLIRPALYDAFHFAWPVQCGEAFVPPQRGADLKLPGLVEVDIVGPVCETSDFLAKERYLPPVARGDLIAIFTAGAFGFVMASHYNSRPNAAEVLVDGDKVQTIRRRETYADLVAPEENRAG